MAQKAKTPATRGRKPPAARTRGGNHQEAVQVSKESFNSLRGQLDEVLDRMPTAPVEGDIDKHIQSLRDACETEGVSPHFLAKKLRYLLDATTPKWDKTKRDWVFFVDGELWRRCIEMGFKIFGGYEKRPEVNVNINVDLENILRNPSARPDEIQSQIADYFDNIEVVTAHVEKPEEKKAVND